MTIFFVEFNLPTPCLPESMLTIFPGSPNDCACCACCACHPFQPCNGSTKVLKKKTGFDQVPQIEHDWQVSEKWKLRTIHSTHNTLYITVNPREKTMEGTYGTAVRIDLPSQDTKSLTQVMETKWQGGKPPHPQRVDMNDYEVAPQHILLLIRE